MMPKTEAFYERDRKTDRKSIHLDKGVSELLEIYCKVRNENPTRLVNKIMSEFLSERFSKLKD